MMLLVFAALAIFATLWSGQWILCGCVAVVLWGALLLHQRDLRLIEKALSTVRKPSLNALRSAVTRPWSRSGARAAQQLDTTLYRVGVLQWELDQQRSRNQSVRSMQAPLGNVESVDFSASSDLELQSKVLDHMATSYRARCVALVEATRNTVNTTKVILKGNVPPHTERYIESFLRGYLDQGSSAALGYVSHVDAPRFFGDFGTLGIYHTIVEPVQLAESEKVLVLWWGFGGIPPTQEELERAQELREVVAEHWQVLHVVRSLSSKAQRAESLIQQRDQYLTQLSHDLRTPLHNVLAVLSLMRDEGHLQSEELLDVATINCRALGELLEDVLDYARHEAGFLLAKSGIVDLREVLVSLVASFRISAKAKGLDLILEPVPVHVKVDFDARHLRRILSNLLSNAIKYTEQGNVFVVVTIEKNSGVHILVRDTGRGMSIEEQARLFQPFVRLSNDASEGNGLGLVVTKLLAAANGARINVISELGKGSAFTLEIDSAAVRFGEGGVERQVLSRHILVVDDDLDTLRILERLLARAGFQVSTAKNSKEAVSCIDDHLCAIITDQGIPGGCKEVLRHCQAVNPEAKRIVCSGNIDLSPDLIGLVHRTFEKPLESSELLEYLAQEERAHLPKVA